MPDHFTIHPDYRSLLESAGLTDFEAIMNSQRGEIVGHHRGRDTARLEVERRSGRCPLFVKRDRRPLWQDLLMGLVHGCGWATKARREFETLRRLKDEGFHCAEPVAYGQRGTFRPKGFLILAGLSDARVLPEALAHATSQERNRLLAALAREVARFHNAGFNHPDLYSKHVWVARRGETWRIFFLDLQRTRRRKRVSWKRRLYDLAALDSTTDPEHASRTERLRFLRIYLEASGLQQKFPQAARRILRRLQKLHSRRATWRRRYLAHFSQRKGPVMQPAADGWMWFDSAHQSRFRRHGLDHFDAVMQSTSGTLLRRLADRENWCLPWREAASEPRQSAYLKRHRGRSFSNRLRAWFRRPPRRSPGGIEAQNILDLELAGVATMELLAYGERLSCRGVLESFVLTEEITEAVPLDALVRERFVGTSHRDPQLQRLVKSIADVARRFHRHGYNHRDFYGCHFLIREPAPGCFRAHLIDLQRVQHRRVLRGRWIVKDLAQLGYSLPSEIIGPRTRLAFLKRYLGVSRLRPQDKRLVRRVLAKQRWIERHGYPP